MTGEFLDIDPNDLYPLHAIHRDIRPLVADMTKNGWQGRPILVIDTGNEYFAWSGSHRIPAAIEAGLATIPCYVLHEDQIVSASRGEMDAKTGHVMDYERLEIMRRVGDENAVAIMRQEL